ncbi:pleiotropic drug resistance abc transporter [Moniliophthora roreri]|nr:pleiotropic drug resistance abc transporter [Moniliophthora roreri]
MFEDSNLRVVGLGPASSYQSTFGSLFDPRVIIENIQKLRHPTTLDLLSGFEAVAKPGIRSRMRLSEDPCQPTDYSALRPFTPQEIRNIYRGDILFCPEDDIHVPMLTVNETIKLAARLRAPHHRLGHCREECAEAVADMLLTVFDLKKVRHTLVGDAGIRAILAGTVFLKVPKSTEGYFSRGGVIFASLFPALMTMSEIPELFAQRAVVLRHKKLLRGELYTALTMIGGLNLNPLPYAFEFVVTNEFRTVNGQCEQLAMVHRGLGHENISINKQACPIVGPTHDCLFVRGATTLASSGLSPSVSFIFTEMNTCTPATSGATFFKRTAKNKLPGKVNGETHNEEENLGGFIAPGRLAALMGESGTGKTTLLNVLSQRVYTGVATGDKFVNGQAVPSDFQAQTGYCRQTGTHIPKATVREAFLLSAKLRQPFHASG